MIQPTIDMTCAIWGTDFIDNRVYCVPRGLRLSGRLSSLLLIHDDSELLDALTCFFEARGFAVAIAGTAFAAISRLEAHGEPDIGPSGPSADDRAEPDVILAGWDLKRTIGEEVYQWALRHRYHLRDRFVFVAEDPPEGFDALVHGRCLLVDVHDQDELARVTESAALRGRMPAGGEAGHDGARSFAPSSGAPSSGAPSSGDSDKPSLLLVEDEPLQLMVMRLALAGVGFSVTTADCGEAAVAELQRADYDVILSDWFMDHGSGSDLYHWLGQNRPDLKRRCVFVSAANPNDCAGQVPDCAFLPKGQDSPALFRRLKSIAGDLRAY